METRLLAQLVLTSVGLCGVATAAPPEPLAPGVQSPAPGPAAASPAALEHNRDQRRAIRGCPVDAACRADLRAGMREFELEAFGNSDGPWLSARDPRRTPAANSTTEPPVWLRNARLPDLPMRWDPRVIKYLEFYRDDPRGRRIMRAWLRRQGRYRAMIAEELRRAGLPRDLLYVAMIESSYDPSEYSRSGASGLWQFMPAAGRIYGLAVNRWLDERNDPLQSTRAVVHYFADLYHRFGDWHLALAAYNAGYGAMLRATAKYNTNDFWKLLNYENALPWESSVYVPKALAVAIVGNNLALFGYADLERDAPVTWDYVTVPKSVPLSAVARAAATTLEAIETLNPQLRRKRTPPGVTNYAVRIPRGRRNAFAQRFPQLQSEWDDYDAYVVHNGQRFEDIATEFAISRSKLRNLNGFESEAEVRGGMTLVVPKVNAAQRAKNRAVAKTNLHSASVPAGTPGEPLLVAVADPSFKVRGRRRVFYRVVSGDSLFVIARVFGVDRRDLARWNGLASEAQVHARMVLQVWTTKDFDAAKANVALLDPAMVKLVKSGSKGHLDATEAQIGRQRVIYTAKKAESFEDIGKKYGLSHRSLARINRMSPFTVLQPGQQAIVYEVVDPKASDRAKQQAEAARKAKRRTRRRPQKAVKKTTKRTKKRAAAKKR